MQKYLILILFLFINNSVYANDIIIVKQPQSIRACESESATISVSAYSLSDKTLSFQWYKDNIALTNEVSPILQFESLVHSKAGTYYCKISNSIGESINSNVVALYILRETLITTQPQDVIIGEINKNSVAVLTFDAHVGGLSIDESIQIGEFVKIQWYRVDDSFDVKLVNNAQYDGVNSNKLSIKLLGLPELTYYYAEIEGKCGIAKTNTIAVKINAKLLNLSINGLMSCEGNYEQIIANIENPENYNLEYKWYKDGKEINWLTNVKGIKTTVLSFEPILSLHKGKYKLEAKIKGLNYSVYSNEVDVSISRPPNIVCVRMDTLYGGQHPNVEIVSKDTTYPQIFYSSWLNIFFEDDYGGTQYDVYHDGNLVKTLYSDASVFSLGNIYYLRYSYDKKDSSKFWVIAHNQCGIAYSDTVSLYEQTICDPFNQFLTPHCEDDSLVFYLDYKEKEPKNELRSFWNLNVDVDTRGFQGIKIPTFNETTQVVNGKFHSVNSSKLADAIYKQMDTLVVEKTDSRLVSYRITDSTIYHEDEFCCFYVKIGVSPTILKQSTNKIVNYSDIDTLFFLQFDNEYYKKINVELYYMQSRNSKPILIDKSIAKYGGLYEYIKQIDYFDFGYYYAVARYNNYCKPVITDTVYVSVSQQGITNISDDISQAKYSFYPNPASDFINISIDDDVDLHSREVQILNLLGLVVSKQELRDGNNRIDISNLARGTYFIKVGDKVEKFVKM